MIFGWNVDFCVNCILFLVKSVEVVKLKMYFFSPYQLSKYFYLQRCVINQAVEVKEAKAVEELANQRKVPMSDWCELLKLRLQCQMLLCKKSTTMRGANLWKLTFIHRWGLLVAAHFVSACVQWKWFYAGKFCKSRWGMIHILSKNSQIENPIITKLTFLKSQFTYTNSPFSNLIFRKIHVSKISIFTKFTFLKFRFTFLKSHSWQNLHFWNTTSKGISGYKVSKWDKILFLTHCSHYRICGKNFEGRVQKTCKEHPMDTYLLDVQRCPRSTCQAFAKDLLEYPLPKNYVPVKINTKLV